MITEIAHNLNASLFKLPNTKTTQTYLDITDLDAFFSDCQHIAFTTQKQPKHSWMLLIQMHLFQTAQHIDSTTPK